VWEKLKFRIVTTGDACAFIVYIRLARITNYDVLSKKAGKNQLPRQTLKNFS
jgi:hypothetical protein